MKVDNPQAFRFILQDEIYLLNKEKGLFKTPIAVNEPVPDIAPLKEATLETPEITFNYLGNNQKNFLVLVNYADTEHIDAAHLAALENILKRKDMAVADVAIVNTHRYQSLELETLRQYFKPSRLLIMGQSAQPIDIAPVELNKLHTVAGLAVLYSFSFGEMMNSNEHKKAFWDQMKLL